LALWLPGASDDVQLSAVRGPAAGAPSDAASATRFPWQTYLASLAVSAAAAALATAIGGSLAAVLALTDLPGRSFWATALALPFLAPSTVWTLGQTYCYGAGGLMERCCGDGLRPWLSRLDQGGFVGAALVLGEIHAPLALLLIARGLSGLRQAGFESARLYLSPAKLAWWTIGAVRPELATAFLLAFALSLGNFTVPHVLQCRLYPIEIYLRLTNYLDQAGAVRAATVLLVPSLAATMLIALAERRRRYDSGAAAAEIPPIELGRKAWLAGGALGAYLLLTAVLPLAAMIWQCRSTGDFVSALRDAAPETQNTLRIALSAAVVAVMAGGVASSWIAHRRGTIGETLAEMAVMAPLGVPALVLGFAYAQFYNRSWPVDLAALGDTKALIVIGLAARSWPFVTRVLLAGRRRAAPEWHEAARLASLGWLARWRWISGPLLFDHLAAGALLAFVLAMGEVEISQLLCAPGDGTLALRLFTFLHFGPVHVAASLAVLQLALTALPVFAYWLFTNRWLRIV
jgi:iron(III) transport system permease protein